MDDPLIRVSEAARKIGLNRSTLSRQVKAGLIRSHNGLVRLSEVLEDRANNIDVQVAEAESATVARQSRATNGATKSNDATIPDATLASAQKELDRALVDGQAMPLAKARALKETYLAKLNQLKFEVQSGKLVDAATVKTTVFNIARLERDGWMTWPSQVGPLLASDLGVEQVKLIILLENAVRKRLTERSSPEEMRAALEQKIAPAT